MGNNSSKKQQRVNRQMELLMKHDQQQKSIEACLKLFQNDYEIQEQLQLGNQLLFDIQIFNQREKLNRSRLFSKINFVNLNRQISGAPIISSRDENSERQLNYHNVMLHYRINQIDFITIQNAFKKNNFLTNFPVQLLEGLIRYVYKCHNVKGEVLIEGESSQQNEHDYPDYSNESYVQDPKLDQLNLKDDISQENMDETNNLKKSVTMYDTDFQKKTNEFNMGESRLSNIPESRLSNIPESRLSNMAESKLSNIPVKNNRETRFINIFNKTNNRNELLRQNIGHSNKFIYILEYGQLMTNGKEISEKHSILGLEQMIFDCQQKQVKVVSDICKFWVIPLNKLQPLIENQQSKNYYNAMVIMDQILVFDIFDQEEKRAIAKTVNDLYFNQKDDLAFQNQNFQGLLIIKKGSFKVIQKSSGSEFKMNQLDILDNFNEYEKFTFTVLENDSELMIISHQDLVEIVGNKLNLFIYRKSLYSIFKNYFKDFNIEQTKQVLENIDIVKYQKDQIVQKKKQLVERYMFVIDGYLYSEYDKEVKVRSGACFGLNWNNNNQKLRIHYNLLSQGMSTIGVIQQDKLEQIRDGVFESDKQNKMASMNKNIQLNDLVVLKDLTQSNIKSTLQVLNSKNNQKMVLKVYQKQTVNERQLFKHLNSEIQVSKIIDDPCIVKIISFFKDSQFFYFLYENIEGIKLSDVLQELGLLSIRQTQIYAGCIINIMETLHRQKVMHRDIKPDNFMVRQNGLLKLKDLSCSKIMKATQTSRTFTIVGTAHYTAPEIITGKGYSFAVDYWSLGVCIYEFMCGGLPFAEQEEDPYNIYEQIVKQSLKFPSFVNDQNMIGILQQLLSKLPDLRQGNGLDALRLDGFFDGFDWKCLEQQNMIDLYYPNLNVNSGQMNLDQKVGQYLQPQRIKTNQNEEYDWEHDF